MNTINIALIEDNKEYRDVLELIINGSTGFNCIGAYANGNAALSGIRHQQPDVVLSDLGLPDISGAECIRILKSEFPSIQFLVISISDDEEQVFEALTAGAEGYLTKDTSHSKIIDSVKELLDGGAPMSSSIARKTLSFFKSSTKDYREAYKNLLGKREIEVLEHLVKGWSYKKVADTMFINIETVKSHCSNIYKKMQISSKEALILKVNAKNPLVFKLQEENKILRERNQYLEDQFNTKR